MHGDASAFGKRVEVKLEANTDICVEPKIFADSINSIEFVHRIDVDT